MKIKYFFYQKSKFDIFKIEKIFIFLIRKTQIDEFFNFINYWKRKLNLFLFTQKTISLIQIKNFGTLSQFIPLLIPLIDQFFYYIIIFF